MPSCLKLTFVACSILVCRPRSGWERARALQRIGRGRANPTRKCVFGGAWLCSAPVRSCTPVSPCLPMRTDCVLFGRATGAYARCTWADAMVLAVKDIYASSCARPLAAVCASVAVVRRGCDVQAMSCAVSNVSYCDARLVPVLRSMCECESDLRCSKLV
jgi:hypothetical protein